MAKVALLIGVSEYEPGLTPLPAATKDVEEMQRVLKNPEIGGFDDVTLLINPQQHEMAVAIETLFADRQKDDLVLLFFSGHGIKDENGKLYFAACNTKKSDKGELVKATTVPANSVHDVMSNSRSKREVIILDCCFSGAFAEGWSAKSSSKDDGFVDVRNQLGGEGRAVLTSSTSTQYSFAQPGADVSTYTRYIVEGLETGAADRDQDSFISVDELHEYAKRKVQEAAPAMKPEIYAIREGYKIKLAKAPIDEPKLQYSREVEYWVRDGEISNIGRTALTKLQKKLGLPLDQAVAKEAEVLKPYQDYKENLQEYQKVFLKETKGKFPVNENTRDELKRLQQTLGLRDEDIALIKASQKRRLNLTPKSIGMLAIGVIIGSVSGWFLKPDKKYPPVIPPPPIKVINQFVEVSNVPKGTFQYSGSTSWAFIYPKLELEIKKAYPQFDIKIKNDLVQGSGIGIEKLIDGGQNGLDFSLSSRDVSSEEEFKAKRKLFTIKAIPVAKSGLAVAVNPRLKINALTKEQLSKIFSGKIDNWRQTGAVADIPIRFYTRGGNLQSTNEFRKSLEIIDFGKNINYVNTTSEGLQKIMREPGGIFVGPISDIVPQCRIKTLPIINTEGKTIYPYQRQNFVSPAKCGAGKRNRVNIEAIYSSEYPLPAIFYVVVKQNSQREQLAGQAYANLLLTKQGQDMIKSLQETGNLDKN